MRSAKSARRYRLHVAEPKSAYLHRPPLVTDASVIAAALFGEDHSDEAFALLRGRTLHAPHLLDHEMGSVALKKVRREGLAWTAVASALRDYGGLALERHTVDAEVVVAVAHRYELTAYDAAYLVVAERLGIFDLERGAKVAGAAFPAYRADGAALIRALINLFLDTHVRENGFTEIWPPVLINEASARGTGQIPDKEDQMYVVGRDGFFLAPTAEVPVTNLHRGEILDGAQLPIRYAAYTPCFRREAGAAGRETRGILRLHQFDKVEMVTFERPEASRAALEWLTERAEILLQRLELPYRVLLMATGDMGFVQMRKYDLEVWAPGSRRWLEVSSCSNFGDYQARRMAIRYRSEAGAKPELVHTLNGSGLAIPRVLAALLERGAQPDGSVLLPAVLHSYLGGRTHLAPRASKK